jgi:hypothetical protein
VAGLKLKAAVREIATPKDWLEVLEPELFVTVRDTDLVPAVEYV